jgi:hypothetical protein
MPKQPTKGTKTVTMELPEVLIEQAKEFAQSRRESFKEVVVQALQRHMAYPPSPPVPVVPPPIAPFPSETPPAKKGKK